MVDDARTVLAEVLCEVLESFAFAFGEPTEPADCRQPNQPALQATMDVSGEVRASVALAAPVALCGEFAANVLGVDAMDQAAESNAADALRELLNVTCGRFLTALYGEEPVFDLGPPQVQKLDAEGWGELAAEVDVLAFLVDESPLLARVEVKGGRK